MSPIRTLFARIARRLDAVRGCAARFITESGGHAAIIFGLAAVPLVGAAGFAVDSGRAFLVESRLSQALDAAGLAAARVSLSDDAEEDARRFFDANYPDGYLSSELVSFGFDLDDEREFVTVSAEAEVPTTLMRILGRDSVRVRRETEIQRLNRGLELALVMDNTGSMRGSKINDMKSAARELIDVLFGDRDEMDNLFISLTPYTATVNIGAGRTGWLRSTDQVLSTPNGFGAAAWKGCVAARGVDPAGDNYDEGDAPPLFSDDARFTSYLYEPDVDNEYDPADASTIDARNGAQNNGTGPNLGCGPEITPLTNEKTVALASIDEMLPWHRGGTASNLGMAWGWRTISPRWRDLWHGPSSGMPLDYDDPLMDKAVVLLTDGDNIFYDWPDHDPDGGDGPQGSDHTAYGRLNDWMPGFSATQGQSELDDRLSRLCTAMKDEEIIVYTITFGGSPGSATQALYRDCATQPSNYFHAPSGAQLRTAFRSIGQQLSQLRIVR